VVVIAGRPRFWRSFSGCRHLAGCAPEAHAPRASPLPAAGFLASPCVPSPVSGSRMPRLPLLPVWEKGVGGMRGKRAPQRSGRHRGTTAFLALLLRLQASRRVRAGGARTQGISASSGRFFGKPLRSFSRFGLQMPRLPLLPVWEKGVGGMRGPKRTGKLTYPFTAPPAAGTPAAVTAASAVWWV